ncbi:MAG: hypothetical protein ABI597_09330 [Gammaproteobacteria bacterium]
MKLKNTFLAALSAVLFSGHIVAAPLFSALNQDSTQTVDVTNFLNNAQDEHPSRTESAVKIDVYQDAKVCYTLSSLNFGDHIRFVGSANDPNCKYITQLVVSPLKVGGNQVYNPVTVPIQGAPYKMSNATIIQKRGEGTAPVFNGDGTLSMPGIADYSLGQGVIAP